MGDCRRWSSSAPSTTLSWSRWRQRCAAHMPMRPAMPGEGGRGEARCLPAPLSLSLTGFWLSLRRSPESLRDEARLRAAMFGRNGRGGDVSDCVRFMSSSSSCSTLTAPVVPLDADLACIASVESERCSALPCLFSDTDDDSMTLHTSLADCFCFVDQTRLRKLKNGLSQKVT